MTKHRISAAGRAMAEGSATVELVFVAPFVLALTVLVWDVREFVGHRTDLAREIYPLAEVMAGQTEPYAIATVIDEAKQRFGSTTAGSFGVAVITRGTQRDLGVPCVEDDDWCLPNVVLTWPPAPGQGLWGNLEGTEGGACAAPGSVLRSMPAAGQHFQADQQVLPNENPDSAASHDGWISRNMRPGEWWVVVDSCLDPGPGLLAGVIAGLGMESLARNPLYRRAAWGSVHEFADCAWC